MSNQINDGGPAFALGPTASTMKPDADGGGHVIVTHYGMESGMSLRDYFAAKAMQAIILSALNEKTKTKYNINNSDFMECLSLDAYAYADAMLKAREAK